MDSREIQPRVGNGRGVESDQIKAEIDQTRGRIDETLEALGDKLHPRHLLEEVVEYIRSPGEIKGTASKLGHALWHQVQQHPMPSLLIGAGVAWMLSEQRKRDEYYHEDRMTSRARHAAGESAGHMTQAMKEKTGEMAHDVKEKTGGDTGLGELLQPGSNHSATGSWIDKSEVQLM